MSVLDGQGTVPGTAGSGDGPTTAGPGDLGRRLATRRTELRLSIPQVARQARVSARYLEYLEKFPSHPTTVILRRLAAALRTTPAALLGAGAPDGRTFAPGRLERLTPAECCRLLGRGGVGRIAFVAASGLTVLPVNYAASSGTVVLRTSAGSVIAAHGDAGVAFEADHLDEALGQGWSVLVRGRAHRVLRDGELRNLLRDCALSPWPTGERDLYIRIVPDQITGRRIRTQ